ncbi:DUF1330 domain-containing protein [Agarivorans gilvus]|nr:DUF1330 domain-containing protein [Agarivorans gilvus]
MLLKFNRLIDAKACYRSPDYQAIIGHRHAG